MAIVSDSIPYIPEEHQASKTPKYKQFDNKVYTITFLAKKKFGLHENADEFLLTSMREFFSSEKLQWAKKQSPEEFYLEKIDAAYEIHKTDSLLVYAYLSEEDITYMNLKYS